MSDRKGARISTCLSARVAVSELVVLLVLVVVVVVAMQGAVPSRRRATMRSIGHTNELEGRVRASRPAGSPQRRL